MRDTSVVNSLILLFASYFEAPYEGDDITHFFNHLANADYATMRSEPDDFRAEVIDRNSRRRVTIQNEINIIMSKKPYTPDFVIRQGEHVAHIEHFGITKDGKMFLYDEEGLAANCQDNELRRRGLP